MKRVITILFVLCSLFFIKTENAKAQNYAPGTDIIGYGYDVFGEYANQKSKKRFCLFKYSNYSDQMIGNKPYAVPANVIVENISEHIVKTVSGESVREYASNLSAKVGMSFDGFLFGGSVNSSFSSSQSGSEMHYYYTYMDANTKWRISLDTRDIANLKPMLDPTFKRDIDNMPAAELFATYGTHYIASAYLGGRADFTSVSVISENTNTYDIGVAVEAKYSSISGNASLDVSKSNTLKNSKTTTNLKVVGGNSEFANNISDPISYEKWASGIAEMPVLCDFDDQSLRPIWEFASTETRRRLLETEFEKLCEANPLPKEIASSIRVSNKLFYVKSKSDNLYWDLGGFHYYAQTKAGKIGLYEKDVNNEGKQGADRFIKVISHTTLSEFVFFQPQHSDFVADITGGVKTPGAQLQLWNKSENNKAQMFKMIPVTGEANTYFIENAVSGLYLTANGKNPITQENITEADNQKWVFEPANGENEMASLPQEVYSFQSVKGKRFIDVPGAAPYQQNSGAKLQLWDMDNQPDRFMKLNASTVDGYYYVQPLHGTEVWDIQGLSKNNGALLQLFKQNSTANQQFKFVYAGSPLTYYIIDRNSGKAIDASDSKIGENGCPITIWNLHKGDNQKWKLQFITTWQMPDKNQNFHIRCAYAIKYFDLPGDQNSSNANGKPIVIWDLDGGTDRIFKILPSGDHSWVNIEVQNGGRWVSIPSNSKENRTQAVIWDKNGSPAKKFAIQFTSPTTFVIRTNNWKALDCEGGKDAYKKNGTRVIQWDPSFAENQQFKLIYADGPKKGKVYNFLAN